MPPPLLRMRDFLKLVFLIFHSFSPSRSRTMFRHMHSTDAHRKVNEMLSGMNVCGNFTIPPRSLHSFLFHPLPSLFTIIIFIKAYETTKIKTPQFLFFFKPRSSRWREEKQKKKRNTWTRQEMKTSNNSETSFFSIFFGGNDFVENAAVQID